MRSRRRRKDVVIDLTSLLDVVFIVLLIVICYASGLSKDVVDAEENSKRAQQEAEDTKQIYDDMMAECDSLVDYAGIIIIRIPPNERDYTQRVVKILGKGEDEIKSFELNGNTDKSEEIKKALEGYISGFEGRPVIISLNDKDEEILYRDEKTMNNIISVLKENNPNIYIK